jgi:hypothetical protein
MGNDQQTNITMTDFSPPVWPTFSRFSENANLAESTNTRYIRASLAASLLQLHLLIAFG